MPVGFTQDSNAADKTKVRAGSNIEIGPGRSERMFNFTFYLYGTVLKPVSFLWPTVPK
jgi:hypothetical protein